MGYEPRTEAEMAAFTEALAVRPYIGHQYVAQPAPGFDVAGIWHSFPCHTRTGYAAHAVAIHALLETLGVPTQLTPHPTMDVDIDKFPADREEMLFRWTTTAVGIPELMLASFPPDLNTVQAARLTRAFVCYIAFEATRVSEYTVRVCNADVMTALWCVSPFTAKAYIDSGVDPKKVFVVTPPICDGPWKRMFSSDAEMQARGAVPVTASAPFIFGTLGTWHERKGFHDLIRAYFKAFKRTDPVALHIRTSHFGTRPLTLSEFEKQAISEISAIAREYGDLSYPSSGVMPRVKLLTGTKLTDAEVISWLGTIDAYVDPSYGEGLGIPPIWAGAQGVPVVTSDFGAVGDIFGDRLGTVMFPSRLEPVDRGMFKYGTIYGEESQWGRYDPADLGNAMRTAYERGRQRCGPLASGIRDTFGNEATALGLRQALGAVVRPELLTKWGLR